MPGTTDQQSRLTMAKAELEEAKRLAGGRYEGEQVRLAQKAVAAIKQEIADQREYERVKQDEVNRIKAAHETKAMFALPKEDPELKFQELLDTLLDSAGLDGIPEPVALIGGDVLFENTIATLIGTPGHGKSFVALDMAGCIGTGEDWHGRAVKQGSVLYLVAEGVSGVRSRVRAWEHSHGMTMANVKFIPMAIQSGSEQWALLVRLVGVMKPALIVLDTLARVTVGMEENSAKEMGQFVQCADDLRQACDATVLIVHHKGKTGGDGRGSSALLGAITTTIVVDKSGDQVTVKCPKQKDAAEFDDFTLRLTPTLGSAVLISTVARTQEQVDLGNAGKILRLMRSMGQPDSRGNIREMCMDKARLGLSKSSFDYAFNTLKDRGAVVMTTGRYGEVWAAVPLPDTS